MKILMLGWELPPWNSGGLGVACYQMCKHLALEGVSIDFVLPYQPAEPVTFMRVRSATNLNPAAFINLAGVYDSFCYLCNTNACNHIRPSDVQAQQRQYVQFVEQLVASEEYDAIHAHDWLTFQAGIRAKQLTGKPLIAHVHATEFDRAGMRRGNELVHEIEYNALLMADAIVAVSQFTKDLIVREYTIPADKIEVIHNSIDRAELGGFSPNNSYIYLQKMKELGYKVVVSLGRLSLQKGVYHLLAAAQKALQVNPKLLFLVVGDGELHDELIELAAEFGVAHNVIFTGFLRGKRWRDAYAIGDMFVMSSVSEPFGLTALEAAGYHNAVLLSKQCGVSEVLHTTLKFDFWDSTKLANAIVAVAEHDSLQTTLADGAQQEVRELSWAKAVAHLQRLYRRSLAGAGA